MSREPKDPYELPDPADLPAPRQSSPHTMPVPPDATEEADPQNYYQDLYNSLNDAYWAATQDGRDKIGDARDNVFIILTAITRARLDKNTQQLDALTALVEKTNDELEDLQNQLQKIVTVLKVANTVEVAIARVLSLAGNIIPG